MTFDPVLKTSPQNEEPPFFSTMMDEEQIQRVEALVWARRIMEVKKGSPAFGSAAVAIPEAGTLCYLAEWILGYSLEDEPELAEDPRGGIPRFMDDEDADYIDNDADERAPRRTIRKIDVDKPS